MRITATKIAMPSKQPSASPCRDTPITKETAAAPQRILSIWSSKFSTMYSKNFFLGFSTLLLLPNLSVNEIHFGPFLDKLSVGGHDSDGRLDAEFLHDPFNFVERVEQLNTLVVSDIVRLKQLTRYAQEYQSWAVVTAKLCSASSGCWIFVAIKINF